MIGAIVQMFFVIFTMYYLFRDGDKIFTTVRDALPLDEDAGDGDHGQNPRCDWRECLRGTGHRRGSGNTRRYRLLGVGCAFGDCLGRGHGVSVDDPDARSISGLGARSRLPGTDRASGKALLMVLWGTLVIGMADNFLRPKLVGERTKLHELLIFFAVLGGLQVFGVLGIVLGPVVLAITLALVDVFKAADREAEA